MTMSRPWSQCHLYSQGGQHMGIMSHSIRWALVKVLYSYVGKPCKYISKSQVMNVVSQSMKQALNVVTTM